MKRNYWLLLAVGVLAATMCLLYARRVRSYHHDRRALWDVYAALIYYIEDNACFPDSPDTLMLGGILNQQADGSVVVPGRATSDYAPYTYEEPIWDLSIIRIHWGADLSVLRLNGEGTLREQSGRRGWLIDPPLAELGAEYSAALVQAYRELIAEEAK